MYIFFLNTYCSGYVLSEFLIFHAIADVDQPDAIAQIFLFLLQQNSRGGENWTIFKKK